ncbi:hypothetical protein YC2023_082021 [Brassica napus]
MEVFWSMQSEITCLAHKSFFKAHRISNKSDLLRIVLLVGRRTVEPQMKTKRWDAI